MYIYIHRRTSWGARGKGGDWAVAPPKNKKVNVFVQKIDAIRESTFHMLDYVYFRKTHFGTNKTE